MGLLLLFAVLASIVLVGTTLPGLIKAVATGVIVRKEHGAVRIERSVEPERFKRLLGQRVAQIAIPLILLLGVAAVALRFWVAVAA